MDKNNPIPAQTIDPQDELKSVLQKLDMYVDELESNKIHWHKSVDLIRCFLSQGFRKRLQDRQQNIQQQLFNAIDWLKKNYFLIEKYKAAEDEEQKKIASYALTTIQRYNEVLNKKREPPKSWREHLTRFITEQAGLKDDEIYQNPIEVPKPIVHQHDERITQPKSRLALKGRNVSVSPVKTGAFPKISTVVRPLQTSAALGSKEAAPSIHEINAFQVKVYSLISEHGLSLESIREALHVIKHAPIEAELNRADPEDKTHDSIISLRQTLCFLPGEVIELSGAFQRIDPKSTHSIPLLETFRLSSSSTQTGHPDPRQHTGWALPHSLIPSFPLRPHQLPLLQPVYRRKNECAVALLPKGRLNNRARQLYALKRKVFELDRDALLKLHVLLNRAIIDASPSTHLSEAAELVLHRFFDSAKNHLQLVDYLADTYQKLNNAVIIQPNEKLKEAYLERSHLDLQVDDPDLKYNEAESILKDEMLSGLQEIQNKKPEAQQVSEGASVDYICAMGALLEEPIKNILLQQYSEIIGFKPPMLNDFEQKLQACVHKQMVDFQDELYGNEDLENEHIIKTMMKRIHDQISEEIKLFKCKSFDEIKPALAELVHELEAYYHSRYYARKFRAK